MELKFTKKIMIALIIIIITIFLPTVNFAEDTTAESTTPQTTINSMPSPLESPNNYNPGDIGDSPVTTKITAKIVKWIRNIGVIVGVLVLTIIGVKYMFAAGAEEKAQYKETLMPVVIGVVMLLGSLALISSIASLFD